MMQVRNLKEGYEELNLPMDTCLDTKAYRDAYRDLIKSKSCKDVTYQTFLQRMRERNIASRKKEFERRRIVFDRTRDRWFWEIFQETLNAGNAGKTKGEEDGSR